MVCALDAAVRSSCYTSNTACHFVLLTPVWCKAACDIRSDVQDGNTIRRGAHQNIVTEWNIHKATLGRSAQPDLPVAPVLNAVEIGVQVPAGCVTPVLLHPWVNCFNDICSKLNTCLRQVMAVSEGEKGLQTVVEGSIPQQPPVHKRAEHVAEG